MYSSSFFWLHAREEEVHSHLLLILNIDTALVPSQASLVGLDGGQPRDAGLMVTPSCSTVEYVLDEVVFKPTDQADLNAFLTRYNGTVLHDGTIPAEGSVFPNNGQDPSGWYLIRIDPATSTTDDLSNNPNQRNVNGQYTFSSERALLWLNHPGNSEELHELKIMDTVGANHFLVLQDQDVMDIGCGGG